MALEIIFVLIAFNLLVWYFGVIYEVAWDNLKEGRWGGVVLILIINLIVACIASGALSI